MNEWLRRPLDRVYPVIFIDAIMVKVRDGQAGEQADVRGHRGHRQRRAGHPPGSGPATAARAPSSPLSVLTEVKNRGVTDVCIAVCDGLKGLPEAINTVWELATAGQCIIHLIRNTFRFASKKYWDAISSDLKPVYTAASEPQAKLRMQEFCEKWGTPYPAITKLWTSAWSEFVPFLDYDVEIRRVICSTNAIEAPDRPLPPLGAGPGPLPQRTGRPQMPVSGHPVPGPDGEGPSTVDNEMEAGTERLRDHLRRPHHPEQ